MKHYFFSILIANFLLLLNIINGQNIPVSPTTVGIGTYYGLTPPLKDLPVITEEEFRQMVLDDFEPNETEKKEKNYPFAETALPKGPDQVWQNSMGKDKLLSGNLLLNIDGQTSPYNVSDCNGAVGPNHYMQTINTSYAIYDKSGNILAGPTNMNQLFGSVPGANCNDGDPVILYDEMAQRWMAAEFSLCGSTDRMLIAVSATDDPTGTWHQYSFDVADMPDYEKFGIWRDAYYMGTNTSGGTDIYAFERDQMLEGGTAQMIAFDNPWKPNVAGVTVPPLDNDGVSAPEGSPGLFIAANDDAWGGDPDQLWIYEFVADWDNPNNSTFDRVQQLDVSPFDSDFGPTWDNIIQPGTSQKLDGIIGYIMNRPQYRNFGTYETIVCCHTVDVDQTDHAGIRWYELRRTEGGDWTVRQEGTYAPDEHSRWMASIVLNGQNELGIGYSISSSTEYPGLRIAGQNAEEYQNASGILNIAEDTIVVGTQSQTNTNRWGDYFNTSVDPVDDHTFWFSGEYKQGSGKKTKIASFQFSPPSITAVFTADQTTICNGGDVIFTDLSYGYPVSWIWSFPGGIPDSYTGQDPPPVTYNTNGSYDVSLTVSDGIENNTFTAEDYIVVKDIIAEFSTDLTTVVIGNSVTFTDNSICEPVNWEWVFEGGMPDSFRGEDPPEIVYENLGTFDVSLIVTSAAGTDTLLKPEYIEVIECSLCPSVYSDTYYDWISNVTFNTINNNSGSVGYEDFTDISTDVIAGSTYPVSVTIDVVGSWEQHGKVWFDWNQDCSFDDDTEGYYLGQTSGTGTLTLDILVPEDAVPGPTTMRVSELWEESPPPCGGGTYGETEDYTVNVIGETLPPEACMTAVPVSGVAPLSVGFTDCSLNDPVAWNWNFGDGGSSSEQNPVYVYENPGVYTVTLIAANEAGTDTVTNVDYIEILLTGIIINAGSDEISIAPNPASDEINISNIHNAEIVIYSISGKLMIRKENISGNYKVDLTDFDNGIYMVHIIGDETKAVKKISVIK